MKLTPDQICKMAAAVGLIAIPFQRTVNAANFTWASTDGDYSTGSNWSTGSVPTGSAGATIGDSGLNRSALYSSTTNYTTTGDLTVATGSNSVGTLTLGGTAGTLTFGRLIVGDGAGATGGANATATTTATVNLNTGGTLVVDHVQQYRGGSTTTPTYTLNFNGGTIKNTQAQSSFLQNSNYILYKVGAGGAIFDTSNGNATIAVALSGTTSDGGLTKTGSNTLTLSSALSTYTGNIAVNAGTLT